jgi:carboxymethylenebutenolidase
LHGVWAAPKGQPKGAVLVVHDSQGLTPHISDVVGRFAGAGYAALGVDLLSGPGSPPTDPTQAPMALAALPPTNVIASMRAGVVELGRRAPGVKIGAVGFGFGAGALWRLLGAGDPTLSAAVPFYGPTAEDADFSRSHAAVLALYPENDHKLSESQDNADMAMMKANLVHNSALFPHAEAGFFDDTGTHYNADAAAKAWQATLDWFKKYLVTAPRPARPLPASSSNAPSDHPTKASTDPKTS